MLKNNFFKYFNRDQMSVIGMIHVRPLPGTPCASRNHGHCFDIQQLIDHACNDALIYLRNGIHGILVENMFDIPYIQSEDSGPEITACMTRICTELRRIIPSEIPCGIQILAGLNQQALAVTQACQFQFIRTEGFIFSHVADEGLMPKACAGPLLRYRRQIDAEQILILSDIKKKHCSHSITDDLNLVEMAKAAKFFLTDGIIITGRETGDPPSINDIDQINQSSMIDDNQSIPILIGSGVTEQNLCRFFDKNIAAIIVGSYFKQNGKWFNHLSEERIKCFMYKYNQLQRK